MIFKQPNENVARAYFVYVQQVIEWVSRYLLYIDLLENSLGIKAFLVFVLSDNFHCNFFPSHAIVSHTNLIEIPNKKERDN